MRVQGGAALYLPSFERGAVLKMVELINRFGSFSCLLCCFAVRDRLLLISIHFTRTYVHYEYYNHVVESTVPGYRVQVLHVYEYQARCRVRVRILVNVQYLRPTVYEYALLSSPDRRQIRIQNDSDVDRDGVLTAPEIAARCLRYSHRNRCTEEEEADGEQRTRGHVGSGNRRIARKIARAIVLE